MGRVEDRGEEGRRVDPKNKNGGSGGGMHIGNAEVWGCEEVHGVWMLTFAAKPGLMRVQTGKQPP